MVRPVSLSAETPDVALCVGVRGGVSGDGSLQAVGRRQPLAGDRTHSDDQVWIYFNV